MSRPFAPPHPGVPDEELARRIQDGDAAAAAAAGEALFGRYKRRVYLWCFRFVRDHERALDLAQDILLSAWRAMPRFDARAPFACWLYAIARNRCCSAVRRVSLTRDEQADLDGLVDERQDQVARLEEAEEEAALHGIVFGVLDRRERDAIYLRCWERLPVDEITRRLELHQASGARGLLQTARRKLRAAFDRREEADRAAFGPATASR